MMKQLDTAQIARIVSALLVNPGITGELDEVSKHLSFVHAIASVVADHCGGEVRRVVSAPDQKTVLVQVAANDSLPNAQDNIWTRNPVHVAAVAAAVDDAADEADITHYLRQQIEDGNLSPEDVPIRMARYGLMDPVDFAAEMRERIEMQADEPDASRSATRMSI